MWGARAALAAVLLAVAAGCASPAPAPNSSPRPGATPTTAPPVATSPSELAAFYGSYRATDGRLLVIARLGWYFDASTADYRMLYDGSAPNRFFFGAKFAVPEPKVADLVFSDGGLTVTSTTGALSATRVANKETAVSIDAGDARLAAAITDPPGSSPHGGIVVVHGAERGERYFYDVWVGIYTSLGYSVLTYDKRGVGDSTGRFIGGTASDASLATYADDASAALRLLAGWPGVVPKRVGFHGGSQGGWTVPLAIQRHGLASFAILASAAATTVGQTDLWASFTAGGASAPTLSDTDMLAQVRADHSGYDPASALAALAVPTLWLLGDHDRKVPTALVVEVLNSMNKPNFTVRMLPTGHALQANPTGLTADDDASPGLAPDLVPDITTFLGGLG